MDALLKQKRLLPLYTVKDIEDCIPIGHCLVQADLPIIEVAFRSDKAQAGIRELKKVPGLFVGAGTVKTMEELDQAIQAGADFIVSPGSDLAVIRACMEHQIPIYPGIVTPSEILASYTKGIRCFKFFPAASYGGIATLKALHGPFPDITFLPTGGVDESNYLEYLQLDYVLAVGGSFILPSDLLKCKDYIGLENHIARLLHRKEL